MKHGKETLTLKTAAVLPLDGFLVHTVGLARVNLSAKGSRQLGPKGGVGFLSGKGFQDRQQSSSAPALLQEWQTGQSRESKSFRYTLKSCKIECTLQYSFFVNVGGNFINQI